MLLTLGAALTFAGPGAAAEDAGLSIGGNTLRTTVGGETWLSFDDGLLSDLGIALLDFDATAHDDRGRHAFAVRAGGVRFWVRDGAFEDLVSGAIEHSGGLALGVAGETLSLQGFTIRPGTGPRTFALSSAKGEILFTADHMHAAVDRAANTLRMFNLDLRIAAPLAERLGRPELTGLAVGTLAVETGYDAPITGTPRGGACSTPNWLEPDVEVDVALIGIDTVQQSGSAQGGALVMTPSATLKNVGTADVAWWEKFSGAQQPYGVSQHPFLVWALYRTSGGKIEQIGRSSVKHAFFTINSACSCFGSNILWSAQNAGGTGCEDTYSASTNNDTFNLGPRDEIAPNTGIFEECGSHFDPGCTGNQTHSGGHDAFEHKMRVLEADLATPGATYLFHAWYLVRDDIDIFNTMGYRRITPTAPNFPFETPLIAGSALDAWVDPASPPPGEANETLDSGEGHVQLAVKTTDLGGGTWRYEYALLNHDFDRAIDSFHVPLPPGAAVFAATFGDLDDDPGNDWVPGGVAEGITWQAPVGGALSWGTLFNFTLDTDAAPLPSLAEIGALDAGGPDTFSIGTLAPRAVEAPILCDVDTDAGTYTNGQQITLSSLRFVNTSGAGLPARLRLQIRFGAAFTGNLVDLGAGGGFTLPNGANLQLAPIPLLVVQPSMPRGSWSMRCALEDPVSGDVIAEDIAPMTFE